MTTLITTSVVRGTRQGESHGGVYLVDLDQQKVRQVLDWDHAGIDWQGRGWDRGLRGIAFDGEDIYIAASDELFVYNPAFEKIASYRNPYLKHCHEISCYERRLYLTSTGYDSLLGFDLDNKRFCWGMQIRYEGGVFSGAPFDPDSIEAGPLPVNELHINSIYCNKEGMFFSGLRTGNLLVFDGKKIHSWVTLPVGVHNAKPWRDGVLFNDTEADLVRYVTEESQLAFKVPRYKEDQLTHTDMDDSRIARQSFGRGLCQLDDEVIAAGSSPSTIALHDTGRRKTILQVTLTRDIRNAIHGLEIWPYY